jgi:beta-glucosidase
VYWQINDADAVVAVVGLSPLLEGENGDAYLSEAGGDKKDIRFPYAQLKYLRALKAKTKKPLIVVVATGSAIELKEVEDIADAVIVAWYPGEEGGNAAADILFGNTNPSGRLPVTFYQSTNDLPAFEDYSMKERTYRYFSGKALHAFGYGLNYTQYEYANLSVVKTTGKFSFSFNVSNTGNMDGEEVVQLYLRRKHKTANEPIKQLKNFKRVAIKKGNSKAVSFEITDKDLEYWDENKNGYTIYQGEYEVLIGTASDNIKLNYTINIGK